MSVEANLAVEGDLLDLVGMIYDAGFDPTKWTATLGCLARWVGADAGIVGISDVTSAHGDVFTSYGVSDETMARWNGAHGGHDPWAEAGSALTQGDVTTGARIVPLERLRETDLYREVLQPGDIEDCLVAIVAQNDTTRGWVNLYRGRGRGLFSEQDILTYSRIVPHLQRAARIHSHFVELDLRKSAAVAALDLLPFGVIACGARGEVISVNQAAKAILEEEDTLALVDGRLRTKSRQDSKNLERLLHNATETSGGRSSEGGGVMRIARDEPKAALSLLVSPVSPELPGFSFEYARHPARAVIVVSTPEAAAEPATSTLCELFGLTPAEARLTLALSRGQSVQEYAAAADVTVGTARWCLKQVQAKTGVHRQAELVSLVLSSVAQLGM